VQELGRQVHNISKINYEKFALEEREVIPREYGLRLTNNVDAQANEKLVQFLYKGNTIAESVIGTPESIATFDLKSAKKFHAATHRPENAVLFDEQHVEFIIHTKPDTRVSFQRLQQAFEQALRKCFYRYT
jgi:hypothetical protein